MKRNPRFYRLRRDMARLMRAVPGIRYGMLASIANVQCLVLKTNGEPQ